MNDIVEDIEESLRHLPKFIRRDVAEAMTNNAIPRSFKSFSDRSNTLKILESATEGVSSENKTMRILLVELILQEMKIKSLEHRLHRLEREELYD